MKRYKRRPKVPHIRPLWQVERQHIREAMALMPDAPLTRVAFELEISLSTLTRRLKEWASGESVVRDRR